MFSFSCRTYFLVENLTFSNDDLRLCFFGQTLVLDCVQHSSSLLSQYCNVENPVMFPVESNRKAEVVFIPENILLGGEAVSWPIGIVVPISFRMQKGLEEMNSSNAGTR